MYTFAALPVTRNLTMATPQTAQRRTTAPLALRRLPTAPQTASATTPQTAPAATPAPTQQPIVVVVPQQQQEAKSETPAAPEEPWYRKSEFIGGVVSVVVLTILGMLVQKAGTKADIAG